MSYLERAKKFRTKKRLGQNFLVDERIITRIIDESAFKQDDTVLEIGPGAGFVTEKIVEKVKKLIAVEIDEDAVNALESLKIKNLQIVNQDILKTKISDLSDEKVKIVANIPYYITSPIIIHLLGEIGDFNNENRNQISEIILMVQYEVAKRIVADEKSSSKEYGLLSILVNYWAESEFICKVPSKSFYPSPKVDSALIKLKIRQNPLVSVENPKLFRQIIKTAFSMRRKTLKNNLLKMNLASDLINKAFEMVNIDEKARGETLSISKFKDLTDSIEKLVSLK